MQYVSNFTQFSPQLLEYYPERKQTAYIRHQQISSIAGDQYTMPTNIIECECDMILRACCFIFNLHVALYYLVFTCFYYF